MVTFVAICIWAALCWLAFKSRDTHQSEGHNRRACPTCHAAFMAGRNDMTEFEEDLRNPS